MDLSQVPENHPNYVEIAKRIVTYDWRQMRHVPVFQHDAQVFDDDHNFVPVPYMDYFEISKIAVGQNGMALEYVDDWTLRSHLTDGDFYTPVAKLAVQQNPKAIEVFVDEWVFFEKGGGYAEVAMLAVQQDSTILELVANWIEDYAEIAKFAVQQNALALQFVRPKVDTWGPDLGPLKEYTEIAMLALQQNPDALEFVPRDHPNYVELSKHAEAQRRKISGPPIFPKNAKVHFAWRAMCKPVTYEGVVSADDGGDKIVICTKTAGDKDMSIMYDMVKAGWPSDEGAHA